MWQWMISGNNIYWDEMSTNKIQKKNKWLKIWSWNFWKYARTIKLK